MEEDKEKTITIRKDSLWKYSTFVLLAIVIIAGIIYVIPNNTTGNAVAEPGQGQGQGALALVSASVDDDAILGNPDAPVTIIEFSDYQCPFCARFHSETLPQIKSQYIDTGKVRFVYRDLPLSSIHPLATPAAIATECVREQGGDEAFYEMHDKIFENQPLLSETNLKLWAQELGYNIDSCLDSQKFASEVQKDSQDAAAAGIRGTPGFVIMKSEDSEGTPISGAQPFSVFQQIIESKL